MLCPHKVDLRFKRCLDCDREIVKHKEKKTKEAHGAVAGIFVADLHFTAEAPIARAVEENWLGVQLDYVRQLQDMQLDYHAPIVICGDIFDRWDMRPWIINHVMNWFKGMDIWAIPGNHDTPHHNYYELGRSAYWTLVEGNAIHHLSPGLVHSVGTMALHPFPYSIPIAKPNIGNGLCLTVAVVHDYIWTKNTGHTGAPEDKRYAGWYKQLSGYDAAFFGDNHKPFMILPKDEKGCTVTNCGSFMRRHSDEQEHRPRAYLLFTDGTVEPRFFGTTLDQFADLEGQIGKLEKGLDIDLSDLYDDLDNLRTEKIEFAKVVLHWCDKNKVPAHVKRLMMRAVGVNDAYSR